MKNFTQTGNTLTLIAVAAVLGGQGFQTGSLFAVASSDAAAGAEVEGNTTGVYRLTAATADVVTVGAKVYWDNTAKNVTIVVATNILIGCAVAAKAAGIVLLDVRLNGTV